MYVSHKFRAFHVLTFTFFFSIWHVQGFVSAHIFHYFIRMPGTAFGGCGRKAVFLLAERVSVCGACRRLLQLAQAEEADHLFWSCTGWCWKKHTHRTEQVLEFCRFTKTRTQHSKNMCSMQTVLTKCCQNIEHCMRCPVMTEQNKTSKNKL